MGWDVMILNTKNSFVSSDIDKLSLPSFGKRQQIIDKLNELFPQLEWDDDLAYAHLNTEDYFGNVGIGEEEEMSGHFWLGIYGGKDPLNFIATICSHFRCIAFDTVTSQQIDPDRPDEQGWKHFQQIRNYVAEYVGNKKEDKDSDTANYNFTT